MKNALVFAGMGVELVGIQIAFILIGMEIDKRMGWPGFGVALLSVVGLVGWLAHIIFLLKRLSSDEAP